MCFFCFCVDPPPGLVRQPVFRKRLREALKIVWVSDLMSLLLGNALILMPYCQPWNFKYYEEHGDDIMLLLCYLDFVALGLGGFLFLVALCWAERKQFQTGVPVWKQIVPFAARYLTVSHICDEFQQVNMIPVKPIGHKSRPTAKQRAECNIKEETTTSTVRGKAPHGLQHTAPEKENIAENVDDNIKDDTPAAAMPTSRPLSGISNKARSMFSRATIHSHSQHSQLAQDHQPALASQQSSI